MFTQQRKLWPASPPTSGTANPSSHLGKGKAVVASFVDVPEREFSENIDWRRFKEVGLLDEASMERCDRQALLHNIAKLEKELFDYQYNMGLLLIDNKECTSKYDQLREQLAQLQESLKRDQSANLIAIAQVETREDNLRNAIASENQRLVDLEKALLQTHAECEQIKLASETKWSDSSDLVTGYHDKSLEVQGKLNAADAKLADANRKNCELERKLHELEIRESVLKRERASLTGEQEVHEGRFSKYKEDLSGWESKLQEKEGKQCEGRRNIDEREEKANDLDMAHKQKEKRLEEEQKRIDLANIALNKSNEDISKKVENMIRKEQNLESYRAELETKEKELYFLAEKLDTREREIQKLLDEHRAAFDAQQEELELDLNRRRNLCDEERKIKFDGLKQREMEMNLLKEKLRKRGQALENELERFKEREKEVEAKSKAIKEREQSLKAEEKRLEFVKKGTLSEIQSERNLKDELDKMKAEISQKELSIAETIEKLKVSKAERAEHLQLQMELKMDIDRYKHQQELISKEGEDLKEDRMKFEKRWEALDEKRATGVTKEFQQLQAEKMVLEDLRHTGDEKMRKNKLASEDYINREQEALNLEKESFAAAMKYEPLLLYEKAENDRNILICDIKARERDLEAILQNKEEEMRKSFERKLKSFHDKREKALGAISYFKEASQKEMKEMRAERVRLENEKQEIALNKEQLEIHQFELRKDIQFLAFVEKIKGCENCREDGRAHSTSNFPLGKVGGNEESLSMQGDKLMEKVAFSGEYFERSPAEIERKDPDSGISWLQKCTSKVFSSSANRKILVMDSFLPEAGKKPREPCKIFGSEIRDQDIAEGGPKVLHLPPDNRLTTVDYQSDNDSRIREVPGESKQSELRSGQHGPGKRSGKGIRRTRTVKDVVEEAAHFLGKNAELQEENEQHPKDISESRGGDSGIAGKEATTMRRKRTRAQTTGSEIDADDSEAQSGSVTAAGRRKRHQPSTSSVQNPGERRYNLRRHKNIETKTAGQSATGCDLKMDYGKDQVASSRAVEIWNQRGSQNPLVHITSLRSIENENLTLDRVARDDGIDVNILENDEDNSDDDNKSNGSVLPGGVSIGKKVWQFFTS